MGISFDLCSIDELHMWVDAHQIDGDMMAEFKENIIDGPFLKEVQNPLESLVTGSLVVGQVEKATVRAAREIFFLETINAKRMTRSSMTWS